MLRKEIVLELYFCFCDNMMTRGDIMSKHLSSATIYEKEFHIDFKGYNALEVDEFLDQVMQDYAYFESLIQSQQALIDKYEVTLAQQKQALLESESRARSTQHTQPVQFSHVDMLKRVSRLEEAVFGQDKK